MIPGGGTALNTLKIQFILQTNYDKLQHLIDKHLNTIQKCLQPLHSEILDADPDPTNEAEMKKLFRKISIYIILASGLGNPGYIIVSCLKMLAYFVRCGTGTALFNLYLVRLLASKVATVFTL